MKRTKALIVIPARLQSTRLPRKLLLCETGKPLIQHTYESASGSRLASDIVVAADDPEMVSAVQTFGGNVVMTDVNATSGSDRVAEVAKQRADYDIIVNVQGDEPDIAPASIDLTIRSLMNHPDRLMSTLATPIQNHKQLSDPACVKVTTDRHGHALYFSRSCIPYARDDDAILQPPPPIYLQHIGLYAYRRDFLLQLSTWPVSPLERIEKLEQLRVLEAGYRIHISTIADPAIGVDTREDYQRFVNAYTRSQRQVA